jgi:phospholipid/cholesterol/gamma-HCH transport system substrate-binding protein
MDRRKGEWRIARGWWATMLICLVIVSVLLSWALYNRVFTSYVPVTITSERVGLMMDPGSQVKMRGVEVGRVDSVAVGENQTARITLALKPAAVKYMPANIEAQISASTAFGRKYVDLIEPDDPSPTRLSVGAVLVSQNVSTEVNTVFDNLVSLLNHVEPAKLNATLSTLADGLRGRGERIGDAITSANQVLAQLNQRSETIRQDWQSFAGFNDTYAGAAQDILSTFDAASTTSTAIVDNAEALDALLLNVIGLAQSGIDLLGPSKDTLVRAVDVLEPTTNLLHKYDPTITCLLVGAKTALDKGAYEAVGGNGRTLIVDAALLLGNDPYAYPDNLPIVAAKGGPGGKPSCGSLPDATKNFPVRYLVTDTGWGTGMDVRPNIGLGHPCYANYLPVTRAVPEPPSIRCQGPPSPGLVTPAPGPLPLPPLAPPPAGAADGATPPPTP